MEQTHLKNAPASIDDHDDDNVTRFYSVFYIK